MTNTTERLTFDAVTDPGFQQRLVALLITDEGFLKQARGIIDDTYFGADALAQIWRALAAYWDTYRRLPASPDLATAITVQMASLSQEMRDGVLRVFGGCLQL